MLVVEVIKLNRIINLPTPIVLLRYLPCLCMHKPASLTCIRPLASQLDAWPKAALGQYHWLLQVDCQATGQGQPISLSGAGPVSLSLPGVHCTAATFQVEGCFSIWPEFDATSSPPRPVSSLLPISALKRSMVRLCPSMSWLGRGGGCLSRAGCTSPTSR
jgi:hypothetical protein